MKKNTKFKQGNKSHEQFVRGSASKLEIKERETMSPGHVAGPKHKHPSQLDSERFYVDVQRADFVWRTFPRSQITS